MFEALPPPPGIGAQSDWQGVLVNLVIPGLLATAILGLGRMCQFDTVEQGTQNGNKLLWFIGDLSVVLGIEHGDLPK